MKYLLMFVDTDKDWSQAAPEELQAMGRATQEWWERHSKAGRIFGGAQLQPATTATTVRLDRGAPIVTDGPFIETKERIGGFALVEVGDLDEALEMARTWPVGGLVEVRPLVTEGMGA